MRNFRSLFGAALHILIISTLLLATNSAFAAKTPGPRQTSEAVMRVLDYSFPTDGTLFPTSTSTERVSLDRSKINPAAAGYKLGETFAEMQHLHSMGRQLIWGTSPECQWTLHSDWMYQPSATVAGREILYNAWDGVIGSELGAFDEFQGSGDIGSFPVIAVTDDNRAVVAGGNDIGPTGVSRFQIWWQFACNERLFSYAAICPDSLNQCGNTAPSGVKDDGYIWPRIALQEPFDGDPVLHVLARVSAGSGNMHALGYFQKVGANSSGTWTYGCAIDTIPNPEAYDIAAAPWGPVGIVWQARLPDDPGCDTCSVNESSGDIAYDRANCDLYIQLNSNFGRGALGTPYQPDGGQPNPNWWENRVNITRHDNDSDTGRNKFRPGPDISALYTSNNEFHVAYVAMFWEYPDFGSYSCRVFHWSDWLGFDIDGIPNIRTVSSAQWAPENCYPDFHEMNQAKPSLAECNGKLYCLWTEFNSPFTTGNENHDDCAGRAFYGGPAGIIGAANADLFISVSSDWGLTWDLPRGLTDTYGGPTDNPNGPCDPFSVGGPCPSEHWLSVAPFGTDADVILPEPSNVIDIEFDHPYEGFHYLDITYLADIDPGAAYMGSGDWYNTDLMWARVPCVEPQMCSRFEMSPTEFAYPSFAKHCEEKTVDVEIWNVGNTTMYLTVSVEEDVSPYSGWLSTSDMPSEIPSGYACWANGDINVNVSGVVCEEGTVVNLTGRVIFDHNGFSDVDTFFVDLIVADTVILPIWDTVATTCTDLIVSSHGNAGNGGKPVRHHLDYCGYPSDEWRFDAEVYLYDASTIIGQVSDADTVMNWAMFGIETTDPHSLIPLHDTTALARVPAHFTETFADAYYTGLYTNHDSTIALETYWFAPTDPSYSCGFVIKMTKVYSLDGAAHDSLVIGEVVDWDIPADSASNDNTSGTGGDFTPAVSNLMYQQGTEYAGWNDDEEAANGGWDENERYGAMMFIRGYRWDGQGQLVNIFQDPYGMYTASNAEYVYPFTPGFDEDSLFRNHSQSGQTVSDSVDTDLHMGMTYLFKYNLDANDTLYFYTAYLTTMNYTFPTARYGTGPGWIAQDAWEFFQNYHLIVDCCIQPGDANHDGSVDISDLTYYVDYLFGGGPGPVCPEEFDCDNNCSLDISDLTYYVDFMFGDGPPPMPCLTCPNLH